MTEHVRTLSRRIVVKSGLAAFLGLSLGACENDREAGTSDAETRMDADGSNPAPGSAEAKIDPAASEGLAADEPESIRGDAAAEPEALVDLEPTPACDDDHPTPPQGAGPFYTPDTPEKSDFREAGAQTMAFTLVGRVVNARCEPMKGALLDFWHADDVGVYDNEGYRYRGHMFADDDGRFELKTHLPGLYPGRTRHIHVHVQGAGMPVLTTQLYFPGEPQNAGDGGYDERLLVEADEVDGEMRGTFEFVLA